MLMQPEKECLFMEIQPINLRNKLISASFLKYFLSTAKSSNTKEAILPKRTCIAKMSMIMFPSKELEELPFSSLPKILFVGLFNAITIPVELSIFLRKQGKKMRILLNLMKKNLILKLSQVTKTQISEIPKNSTLYNILENLEHKFVNHFLI